jgi:hypothetical protein
MKKDIRLEMFKKLVPYLRGALWWAHNDLIKDRQPEFNQNDEHIGHPLLSVCKKEITSRFGAVPMLVGTSGGCMTEAQKFKCILVEGITKADSKYKTYFGSIVMPGRYAFEDLYTGICSSKIEVVEYDRHKLKHRDDERGFMRKGKWHQGRTMVPNWDKIMVSTEEMQSLNAWCENHRM